MRKRLLYSGIILFSLIGFSAWQINNPGSAITGAQTLNGTSSGSATIDPGTTAATLTVSPSVSSATINADTLQLDTTNKDVVIGRAAAATIRLGGVNVASPANYSITGQGARSATDTDTAGGQLILAPGNSTGAAVPPTVQINGKIVGTTGTTAQTAVARLVTMARKTLTSGGVVTLISSSSNSNVPVAGMIKFGIVASDGSAHNCVMTGIVLYGAENTAGTQKAYPSAAAASPVGSTCTGTDTITTTFNSTAVNPSVFSVTSTIVGFTPVTFFINYSVEIFSDGTTPTI